jgi:hypothetical protein
MAEILEHVIIELLGVVYCDFSQNVEATDDVLPEEFLDCRRAYVGDRLCLDPLGEILNRYNGEGIVALSYC